MSFYYPQAAMTLRVVWEDFGRDQVASLQQVYALPIVARRVTVNINDYTQADSFDCEIDYKQFPFDPRTIRACGVTISMQNMGKLFQDNNALNQIIPNENNTVFIGFADEEGIKLDEQSRVVRLEGRDFTALLIDEKYRGGPIDLNRTVDQILSQLLVELPSNLQAKLSLDNRVIGALPNLGQFAPDFNEMGTKKNTKRNESYWDVIQDLVSRAGLIAYIELDRLVISKPRVLYDKKQAKRFIYGKNLKTLEFKRKIGRMKNFNIVVRSLLVESKQVIEAVIPEESKDDWSLATGIPQKRIQIPNMNADGTPGEPKDAPFIAFRVSNIGSKDQLIEVAQKIYEEIGRQQIEGSFMTQEMETVDGQNRCFDILLLRNGTPVSIEIDQGDLKGLSKAGSTSEKVKFLTQRCYEPKVAQVLAESLGRFPMIFYTKSVKFTIDQENGFQIDVDFINFIETPTRGLGLGG
jgi:hypothetical protein